jgi:hypothetical protein
MDQYKPNYIAVVIAGLSMWVLGAIWYNIFGTQWMGYLGITEEMAKAVSGADMVFIYGGSIVAFAVAFYVQDHMMFAFKATGIGGGVQSGFWSWLGFIATSFFVQTVYQMKPIGLWCIDAGYWLIGLIIGSIILATMKKKSDAAPAA